MLQVVTLSPPGSSALIMSGSLLAMLTGGQTSPWCEVVSLLKFAFITSSIGSIGNVIIRQHRCAILHTLFMNLFNPNSNQGALSLYDDTIKLLRQKTFCFT